MRPCCFVVDDGRTFWRLKKRTFERILLQHDDEVHPEFAGQRVKYAAINVDYDGRRPVSCTAGVEVHSFNGLLVDFMRRLNATVVVRGIRAVSDYEYELQMAMMNRELNPEVETIFMLPAIEYTFVSSRLVKEVFRLGGDIAHLVPPPVLEALRARLPVTTAG